MFKFALLFRLQAENDGVILPINGIRFRNDK